MQVDFDPGVISYEELLKIFWRGHSPEERPWSRQYMSLLLFHDAEQEKVVYATKESEEKRRGKVFRTEIGPYRQFYLAEHYHQKYYLQLKKDLLREFLQFYPEAQDFINATSVARVNGYVRGEGSVKSLQEEIHLLGLSEQGQKSLLEIVKAYGR